MAKGSSFKKLLKIIPYDKATQRNTPENDHSDQSPFHVDIGRIIYSNAFRLLDDKTQVVLRNLKSNNKEAKILWTSRSRGSHSNEVAVTAERVANSLGLNSELARAIALAHDLGHPPYGHSGERILNLLLEKYDSIGFDHDLQTLRIVSILEVLESDFEGLNLTNQILADILARSNRSKDVLFNLPEQYPKGFMSLEAQVVEYADKITFIVHDLEDLLRLQIVSWDYLSENLLLKKFIEDIKTKLKPIEFANIAIKLRHLKKIIYNYFLTSIYQHCNDLIAYIKSKKIKNKSKTSIFVTTEKLICCTPKIQQEFEELLAWMYQNIYHSKIKERDQKASYTIKILFDLLYENEELRNIFNQFGLVKNPNESLAVFVKDLIVMTKESYIQRFFNEVVIA